MSKLMLIDAVHPEETRVALVTDGRVDDFDFEAAGKQQLRGNIYLAKVTRVEPSLQAAFIEYGGNRHGFLAFSEIHPDYYQLPQADREALLREEAELAAAAAAEEDDDDAADADEEGDESTEVDASADGDDAESAVSADDDDEDGTEEDDEAAAPRKQRRRTHPSRRYKIQEVIRRRQVMLVQVVKEERGNKGAALTTYLSLAGRYCVLMPNTPRGGGISRKISSASDRRRLKTITKSLDVPQGMGLIVRTAGAKRTKTDIKRDFEYLQKLWDKIRDLTLNSIAPTLINEEGNLVHRAMRDLYDKDISEVLVQGENAYREAKDLAKLLMPSQAKKVKQWKDKSPLFVTKDVEDQLNSIFSPVVQLKSGGYLVINQTEALVAIDVNSGKATRGRNIEQTATSTNLEAAEEACRQMRLRDLAGLIVIDFIDMDENKNIRAIEKKLKDCLKLDRARVQHGRISQFGLMEISRQRRRTGVLESSSSACASCNGTGRQRSLASAALQLLRAIEARAAGGGLLSLNVEAPGDVAIYLLNNKKEAFLAIEEEAGFAISISSSDDLLPGDFKIDIDKDPKAKRRKKSKPVVEGDPDDDAFAAKIAEEDAASDYGSEDPTSSSDEDREASEDEPRRRRRRGRRGGRRRRRGEESETAKAAAEATAAALALPPIESSPPVGKDLPPEDGGAHLDGLSLMAGEILEEGLDATRDEAREDNEAAASEYEPKGRRRRSRGRRRGRRGRSEAADVSTDGETIEATDRTDEATTAELEPSEAEPAPIEAMPTEAATAEADESPKDVQPEPVETKSVVEEAEPITEPVEETVSVETKIEDAVQPTKDSKPKRRGWWSRRKTG
ncbi:MAG: Rne/Rng family ribonuclease [Pseudomonadota bacterium]